ncbi:uncharacterized protein PHALS_01932 [Plasmopara halstedii]|uniref:Uncharacterized protein n=1 Tax=Plasmopara halstedii TaxID=4781 RepID=A0A0P1AWW3_PLAHL|nr:uncharacterized protein PHALS_01932 [Plasmopara halstedii]CEG45649.1 hypothetical protein PHALS_01932 [Plasmopara halstedii]|eukprot:XP_024582018.1 hypothetical protein PHALS_01932 [Plasmopara halstedii]
MKHADIRRHLTRNNVERRMLMVDQALASGHAHQGAWLVDYQVSELKQRHQLDYHAMARSGASL